MIAEDYKELMRRSADNVVKSVLGKADEHEEIDESKFTKPEKNGDYAEAVAQAIAELSSKDERGNVKGELNSVRNLMHQYEVYRTAVNDRAFYRHMLDRKSKITAALDQMDTISRKDGIKDIIFKPELIEEK